MFYAKIKTFFLLILLSSLLLAIGTFFGGRTGLTYAFVFALLINFITYFFSEKIILRLYQAKPISPQQYDWIHMMVHELAHEMKIPKPKLWLVKTPMANAFATGRNPSHSSIAITDGILNVLDRDELRGVLAHELSHIKNRDVLVATIAATIATAIGYLANIMQYAAFWRSSNSRNRSNPFALLAVAILMPIAATLIRLGISRSREYLADETGARYSRDPLALASALGKLQRNIASNSTPHNNPVQTSTASLFIASPFSGRTMVSFFSTHPPMEERIERLRKIHEKMLTF